MAAQRETQAVRMARMEGHVSALREHMATNAETAAEALREIRALREDHRKEVQALTEKHTTLDKVVAEMKGTARGVGIGWAAAFTFLGGVIAAGITKLTEIF